MAFHDLHHVLLVLLLGEDRGRRGQRPHRGGAGALRPRVHVSLVVIADEDEVRSPLGGAGERLDADVEGSPVAGDSDDRDVAPVHCRKPRHEARRRGRGAREGAVQAGDGDGRRGVEAVEDRKTACGKGQNRVLPERLEHIAVG